MNFDLYCRQFDVVNPLLLKLVPTEIDVMSFNPRNYITISYKESLHVPMGQQANILELVFYLNSAFSPSRPLLARQSVLLLQRDMDEIRYVPSFGWLGQEKWLALRRDATELCTGCDVLIYKTLRSY